MSAIQESANKLKVAMRAFVDAVCVALMIDGATEAINNALGGKK